MTEPIPDYDSIDWSEVEQRFRDGALRGKLMRLAATLTAIGMVLLAINLGGLFWLRANVADLMEDRVPLVDATRRVETGLQRALAGLRGWVALHDPRFREQNRVAWDQDIRPALRDIETLTAASAGSAKLRAEVADLTTKLDDLAESQWWVGDVAQTPGNEPAHVEYTLHVLPVKQSIDASVSEIAELAAEGDATPTDDASLAAMLLFQVRFVAADAALRDFIEHGEAAARFALNQHLAQAGHLLTVLTASPQAWTPPAAEHLAAIGREFPWYSKHARDAVKLRAASDWNVAQHLMENETVPLTRTLTAGLDKIVEQQAALMRADTDRVSFAGNTTVALSVLLIVLMAITAYALTNRRAEQITRPIHRLSQATLLLAKGELNENLPITTDDELGRLTVAFNHMRVNLQRSEAALRQAHDRMAAELEGAESYVQSVLPKPLSSADKGVLTDWTFIASAELGGDSFGYHWLDDEHFAIYLLDVCGHGVGPAMLSISALNALRQRALPDTDFRRPSEVLRALNKAFPMQKNQNKFFTIWYGVYNTATHALAYGCGGHHAALLYDRDDGEAAELGMKSFMIGVVDDADFESASVTVAPGSRLYVFSDGLFEVNNPDKQMLNLTGLQEKIRQAQQQPSERLDAILASVRGWQGFDDFGDDYSLLEVSFS